MPSKIALSNTSCRPIDVHKSAIRSMVASDGSPAIIRAVDGFGRRTDDQPGTDAALNDRAQNANLVRAELSATTQNECHSHVCILTSGYANVAVLPDSTSRCTVR